MTNLVSLQGGVPKFDVSAVTGPLVGALISAVAVGVVLFVLVLGIRWVFRELKGGLPHDYD